MPSILNGTGQLVALLLRTLNLAIYAILALWFCLCVIVGLGLFIVLSWTEYGAKQAMRWGLA